MATPLRQSTSCTITLGPFVDSTDGNTEATGLTVSSADVRLSKNGGAFATTNETGDPLHDEKGWYRKALNTTDTNTLGSLVVHMHVSGALPVWREFEVLTATAWDALYASSGGYLNADLVRINNTSVAGTSTQVADRFVGLFNQSSNGFTAATAVSTLTQTQVTGGAYSVQSSSCVLGDARVANLDATVSSRLASASYTSPPSAGSVATAVWAAGTREVTGFTDAANAETCLSILKTLYGYQGVVFVDAAIGSDSFDGLSAGAPKLTLAAAKSAAASGFLIAVGPGTYNERNLFKNGVDWFFSRGAVVNYTGSGNGSMFDDSSTGANGAVVTRIFGAGRFIYATTGASGDLAVFNVTNASSRVYVQCETIKNSVASGATIAGIHHTNGQLTVTVLEDITSDNYDSVVLYGAAGASCYVEANRFIGADNGVEVSAACPVTIRGTLIQSTGVAAANGLEIVGGAGTLNLNVTVSRIVGGVGGIRMDGITGDYAVVRAERVTALGGAAAGLTSGGTLYLDGGLYTSAASDGITASAGNLFLNNLTVRCPSAAFKDLIQSGSGVISVNRCDYRRSFTTGTITEPPPADRVTQALPAATAGASGGLFIAGTNAATTITTALTTTFTGSLTGNVGGNVTGSVGSVAAGGITASSIAADAIGASELAADAANEIADAVLARNIAGGSSTGRTVSQALYAIRNKVVRSGSTIIVYETDDSTQSWTATIAAGTATTFIDSVDPG